MKRVVTQIVLVLAVLLCAAQPAAAKQVFGFNDPWTAPSTLPLARSFGADSARLQIYWGDYEPRPGIYRLATIDTTYRSMLDRGVRPLLDIVSAPSWATARGCVNIYRCQQTPAHDGAFAAFVGRLVARYPQAAGVEIGNEPNLRNWSIQPDAARYAQMLKAGYGAVKSVNPAMPVITAGICCNTATSRGNIGAATFLGQLYANGIRGYYDYIGVHLYPGRRVDQVASDIQSELNGMRSARDAAGDGAQFWVTETGFPSTGVSRYGGGVYTEGSQAQRTAIAYRAISAQPDVAALFLYRLTDPPAGVAAGQSMGLYHDDGSPKPAAAALHQAVQSPGSAVRLARTRAPASVHAGRAFRARVAGRRGRIYQWVVWRGDHWSSPVAVTTRPSARLRLAAAGRYIVAARVATSLDDYLSTPVMVRVRGGHRAAAPAGIAVYPGGGAVDVGAPVRFAAIGGSGSAKWKIGPASASGPWAAHSFTAPGNYQVRLWRDGHETSTTVVVRARPAPVASLALDQAAVYPGAGLRLDASGSRDPAGDVVGYEWDTGNGKFGDGDDTTTVSYSTPGTYTVRVRVTGDGGRQALAARTITVLPYPPPVARIACQATTVRAYRSLRCASDDSQSPYRIANYSWTVNPGGTALAGAAVRPYWTVPGTGTLTLTVTDVNGHSATTSITVTVTDSPPRAVITPPADSSVVLGAPIPFDGTGSYDSAGTIVKWEWDDGQGAGFQPGGQSFAPTYTQAGWYDVRLRVTNDQGMTSTASYWIYVG